MDSLHHILEEHRDEDKQAFAKIDLTLSRINPDVAQIKADMFWVKWIVMAILGAVIVSYFHK